jgi:hypothetical protein
MGRIFSTAYKKKKIIKIFINLFLDLRIILIINLTTYVVFKNPNGVNHINKLNKK